MRGLRQPRESSRSGRGDRIEEPYVNLELITPTDYVGSRWSCPRSGGASSLTATYLSERANVFEVRDPARRGCDGFLRRVEVGEQGIQRHGPFDFCEYRKTTWSGWT